MKLLERVVATESARQPAVFPIAALTYQGERTMELVEFSLQLEPPSASIFRAVRYTTTFLNGEGERLVLTREAQAEVALFQEPFTAAWLLSHIMRDFMDEARKV